jgi:uncharacterized phage protein (predicted DNA packaging)
MEEILDQFYPWKNIISDVKEHLQLPADFVEDDSYIRSLIQVSTLAVLSHVNWDKSDLVGLDFSTLPPPLLHSIRLMVANLYANRESVSETKLYELPKSYDYLLSPYVKY